MKLVFLHGAPAVGKLTIAKELQGLVGGRLLDNHAAIDFARTLFDFGAPGFWDLVRTARIAALEAAGVHAVPIVLMTYCYSSPADLPSFEGFESAVKRHGGELLPVFLRCSEEAIAERIGNPDRQARRKVATMEGLQRFRETYNDSAVPRDNCLSLETSRTQPSDVARTIAQHFALPVVIQ